MCASRIRTCVGSIAALLLVFLVVACGNDKAPTTPIIPPAPTPPTSGSVTVGGSTSMVQGSVQQLDAFFSPPGGTSSVCTTTAQWQSTNTAAVTVSPAGTATAVSVGDADVKATCQGATGTIRISVRPIPANQAVSVTGISPIAPGQSAQYTATSSVASLTTISPCNGGTWQSSNSEVAKVSAAGMVTGIRAGETDVIATCAGLSGSAHLVVSAINSVTVTGMNLPVWVGQTRQLAAVALLRDLTTQDCTTSARWESSNPAGATVSNTGLMSAVGPVSTYITATCQGVASVPVNVPVLAGSPSPGGPTPPPPSIYGYVTEAGTGVPLTGATVRIIGGSNAGASTLSSTNGFYTFTNLVAGSLKIRVDKTGYDTLEWPVLVPVPSVGNTIVHVDISLARSAACPDSVAPLMFKYFPSAGGSGQVTVTAAAGRSWTATTGDSWIQLTGGATGTGTGVVSFQATANPSGYGSEFRQGTINVACAGSTGQNVVVWQVPNCSIALSWAPSSPTVFEPAGGKGGVWVLANSPFTCPWQAVSKASWITLLWTTGAGDGGVSFLVAPNTTGAARTGTIVIGETNWEVKQKG